VCREKYVPLQHYEEISYYYECRGSGDNVARGDDGSPDGKCRRECYREWRAGIGKQNRHRYGEGEGDAMRRLRPQGLCGI